MRIKLAQYVANYLLERNITDVFLVPGGGAMHLDDALGHTPGFNLTFNHHEQACSFAGEGYSRYTGKLSLVCLTSGPGGTNAITGVMGAWVDSVAMLVISGQVKRETTIVHSDVPLRQLGDQEFNITDSVRCMTKFAVYVDDPNKIKYYLDKAIYLATTGRHGPVWIDIPLDVQAAMIETDELEEFKPEELVPEYPHYNGENDKELLDLIEKAERPLIYSGEGIRFSRSKDLLVKFAEKYNIPIVTSWNALDNVWDAHPLFVGMPGTVGTRGGNFNVQNCDLLFILGCRLNIRQIGYTWQTFAKNAKNIVMVDIDENEMKKKTLKVTNPIHTDVKEFLNHFVNLNIDVKNKHESWVKHAKETYIKYDPVLPQYYESKRLNPYVFLRKVFDYFREDETITMGNGSAAVITQQVAKVKKNMTLFTNSGCASMGYGFPAAIGCAVANKGRRVICITGDGSFQMNLQELQTVVFNNFNIKIIYINNNGYSSMKQTQTYLFKPPFVGVGGGCGLTMPDMSKLIPAYGLPYYKIELIADIDRVMKEALSFEGPALIEAVVDDSQFFAPKISSKILPDGTIVSPDIDDMYPFLPKDEYNNNKF